MCLFCFALLQLGSAQPALRRPLDEGEEETLSYAALARQSKQRAEDAVKK